MNSATFKLPPCFLLVKPPARPDISNIKHTQSKTWDHGGVIFRGKRPNLSVHCFDATEAAAVATAASADLFGGSLQQLVSEFTSLTQPIDRVKRLLDYAARLAPLDESARSPENRVVGCTTQVWLEVRIDESGRMRFSADSDSEITKGFISCLVWLLDGATAAEVLAVKTEELAAINVGLYGKVQSRVNTWHNVLIAMQKRTEALVADHNRNLPVGPLPGVVVAAAAADGFGATASFPETRVQESIWQQLDDKLSLP